MYLPNRDELSFRLVLALPKASRIAFDLSNMFLTRSTSDRPLALVVAAIYFMMIFEVSVLPAPDSPEMTMHESVPFRFIVRYAASASAKMCGDRSYICGDRRVEEVGV